MQDSTLPGTRDAAGIFRPPYLWVTVGTCALVFLAAFESLAVTTIMPLVSRELNGGSLYALAFAGPMATGVIGMVGAGNWSDRRGPPRAAGCRGSGDSSSVHGLALMGGR